MIKKYFLFVFIGLITFSCGNNESVMKIDELYISKLQQERENKDWEMQYDEYSPFKVDSTAKFQPLKYYEPSAEFIFKSKLFRTDQQDTISIFGTRGEERKAIIEGYVLLNYEGEDHRLKVYKSFGPQGQSYNSIWFTDQTTGKETYPVGRYLDFKLNSDPEFIYEIDFNKAYNPYCAYSDLFTCPIPTKDDYLDFEIKAGEKNFHTELNPETK
ncbi:MAG: DUF1684 domain-containing protein [Ignavibacteriaceae bacterium]|nr:DUF1684 domain-containing protein [Ignavibacterium sp.]MCC6254305.1 DUF1684 domain-containing protein [Ignavibacteriaceae bacterium]HMN24942.1 DUF1684 domain-containing protein [Ignavibacteriaceae bacterium]HRN25692.1 DUF1684 domain-containing protein [Ignavibacteriaceae bacterium]HRP93885.1 DUF1684 domain-containing protein [Ignavibacteriaceae bacterium]